jgi:drug/metabolite transporter (DMT)-like permease
MFLATITFFTCLHYLPQAEATSIAFMAPLIMLLIAPLVLGERMHKSRWIAALIGFVGVLIIIRPSSGLNTTGVMFGLITAFLFAAMHTLTRKIASDHPYTSVLWSGAVGTVALTLILPFIWDSSKLILSELSEMQWLLMLSLGFSGALGHLLQISAYRNAPASMLAPFIYLQITAAATIGWLIWGHFPDGVTWIGIGIISASGIGIGWVEWRRSTKPEMVS